jgi:hypothetical protein
VPAPMKFKVLCRDAKIPVDPALLKGEMWLDGEPWRNPDHLHRAEEHCWVSPALMSPEILQTGSGTVHES